MDSGAVLPPTETEVMDRSPEDIPAGSIGVEIGDLVSEIDRAQYQKVLADLGLSEKTIKKMKALDGLAKNTGILLAVSLQQTHQNYVHQLHVLSEVADELRDTLRPPVQGGAKDGEGVAIDLETKSYLYRCFTEMVKEQGRGYELMLNGTQAIVQMMLNGNAGKKDGSGAKPGWRPQRKHAKNPA